MKKLDDNWLFSHLIDFEYKQYVLLDYITYVEKNFERNKLFPHFYELVKHYKNVEKYRKNKQSLTDLFPKQIIGVGYNGLEIEPKFKDENPILEELDKIADYSSMILSTYIEKGKFRWDNIEANIEFSKWGHLPKYWNSGYCLLYLNNHRLLFKFTISKFQFDLDPSYGIEMSFVSFVNENSIDKIKLKIGSVEQDILFIVNIDQLLPFKECILPIIKSIVLRKYKENFS